MPYLYGKAVEAHEEGTPVMRPMVFEYPSDPACTYLDTQYMLGESLLVAPVFRDDSICSYYLPRGRWTHLLSDEKRDGGRYYKDTYDYFSLPVYVKPGSIIVRGLTDNRPDYDYTDNIEIHIYELSDGASCCFDLVDDKGGHANRINAVRNGSEIKVTLDKEIRNVRFVTHMSEDVTVVNR